MAVAALYFAALGGVVLIAAQLPSTARLAAKSGLPEGTLLVLKFPSNLQVAAPEARSSCGLRRAS